MHLRNKLSQDVLYKDMFVIDTKKVIRDYKKIDGDIASVLFNGNVILDKKELPKKPFTFTLELKHGYNEVAGESGGQQENGVSCEEVDAVNFENLIRHYLGIPLRKNYGGKKIEEKNLIKPAKNLIKSDKLEARRLIMSEALVPVQDTGDWPARIEAIRGAAKAGSEPFTEALDGLSVIEADNDEEEALSIALIMRETLEDPDKTAALVTPDPSLAR